MKQSLILILFAGLALAQTTPVTSRWPVTSRRAAGPSAPITVGTPAYAHTDVSGTAFPASLPSCPTAGQNVYVGCLWGQDGTVTNVGVTDNQVGNSYPQIAIKTAGGGIYGASIFRAANVSCSGTFTATCNYTIAASGNTFGLTILYPTAGDNGTTDGTDGASGTGTAATAGSISTTNLVDLLFSACTTNDSPAPAGWANGSGYTLPTGVYPAGAVEQDGSLYQTGGMEYKITSSTGTFTGAMTQTNANTFVCAQVAIK